MCLKSEISFFCRFLPIAFILFLIIPGNTYSQQYKKILTRDDLMVLTQNTYGPDDLLVNGRFYIPPHPNASGNPYFQENIRTKGKIIICGKVFNDVEFFYDVSTDKIIILSNDNSQNKTPVLLNREFVDYFYIDEHEFVNLNLLLPDKKVSGFAELIYRSELFFIIIHKKEYLKQYSQSNSFGTYSKLKSVNFILSGDQLIKVPAKKSFIKYFRTSRDIVKKYFRTNHINYKKATKSQLFGLLKFCDELSCEK